MLLSKTLSKSLAVQKTVKTNSSAKKSKLSKKCYSTETETATVEKKVVQSKISIPQNSNSTHFGVAFNSPTWVKLVADLIATEAEIPVSELSAPSLQALYAEQLANVVAEKETLLKEKVSESAYEGLLNLYSLRAAFPLETIEKALHVGGAVDMQKRKFKGTIGASYPNNEDDIDESAINTGIWGRHKMAKNVGIPFKLSYPSNFFSGLSGLLKAGESGLTSDQVAKSKSLLATDSGEIVQMDQPNKLVSIADDNYAQKVAAIRAGKWEEAFPKAEGMNKQETENYEQFIAEQKAFWADPDAAEAQIEIAELTANADPPTNDRVTSFLSNFEEKGIANNEEQIKRFYIFNPVGEALLRNNIVALDSGHVVYTEDFSEYSGGKLRYTDPAETKGRKDFDETTAIMNANVGFGDPKVAAEQIMELKMDRLASWFGLNLDNDLDNLKFHVFMDQYEVSPGESGLDWIMTYPPDHHTFDELPIVKIPSDEDVEDYYKQ